MNLGKLQLMEAFRLTMKTTPILLVRVAAYGAFWVATLIYFAILFGIGSILANIAEWVGVVVAIIAVASVYPLYKLVYRYVFYMIKAAHVAVIAELLQHGQLPEGQSQLAWGRQQVQSRFGQVSIMFVVDELVEGVVNGFTSVVFSIASWLPLGNSRSSIFQMLERIIRNATTYIDEAVMARAFWRRDETIWESAQEGVVLYAMAWKPILFNAVALMVLSYIPFFAALLIFAAPVGFLVNLISSALAAWSIVVILLLAYFMKAALGDAFAMTAMIATYQRETGNLTPDPAMEARLGQVTDKFGELKNRALQSAQNRGVPGFRPQESRVGDAGE
jgi:hypothetical protein